MSNSQHGPKYKINHNPDFGKMVQDLLDLRTDFEILEKYFNIDQDIEISKNLEGKTRIAPRKKYGLSYPVKQDDPQDRIGWGEISIKGILNMRELTIRKNNKNHVHIMSDYPPKTN